MAFENKDLGGFIKSARLEKNITQEEVAEIMGVSPTHIKHIESGHRNPSIELLFKIVLLLDLSLDNFLFSQPNKGIERQRIERLLDRCNDKELHIVRALLDAML